jgi:hypothetical protein
MATSPYTGESWRLALLNRDGQVSGIAVFRPKLSVSLIWPTQPVTLRRALPLGAFC